MHHYRGKVLPWHQYRHATYVMYTPAAPARLRIDLQKIKAMPIIASVCAMSLLVGAAASGNRQDMSIGTLPPTTPIVRTVTKSAPKVPVKAEPVVEVVEEEEEDTDGPTEASGIQSLDNAERITRFCAEGFSEARDWLQENYTDGWPHGRVSDKLEPIDLGLTIGMAIAVNAMRESHCLPGALQGSGTIYDELTAEETVAKLRGLGTAGGCAWGIIQWDSGRRANFATFCKSSNLDPRDLDVQLMYLAYEYYSGVESYSYSSLINKHLETDASLSNVKDAAEIFRRDVERGGTPYSGDAIAENWGNKWSDSWGEKPEGGLYVYLSN